MEEDRRCPGCAKEALQRTQERGVTLLRCRSCEGTFLEPTALASYVERSAGDRSASTAFWRLYEEALRQDTPSAGIRSCVVCRAPLDRFGFGEFPFAVLDRCDEHGVWLDRHDLDRVVRSARATAAVTERSPDDDELSSDVPEVEGVMVCPNCQARFPGAAADARCSRCNVGMFRA